MRTFFRLRHGSLVTDIEHRLLCFAQNGPEAPDTEEQVEDTDAQETEDPAAMEQPEDAEAQGEARRESAQEVAAKRRQELGVTDEDLRNLQLRARTMKGYKDGKVQLSDGSEVGMNEYDSKDSQDAQKELRDLHRMGAITDAELPAKPKSAPVQPRAPKVGPKNAVPADPAQIEADAQASILDDGKGGSVDWSTLTPEERTTRTHDVQARFGVSVDPDTGVVTLPTDVTEANFNRIGGAVGKMGTAFGKWMEKFSGLMGTISGQPVAPNVAPVGPVNNPAETSVKAKLQTTGYAALKPSLEADVQTATADIQRISANLAAAAPVDKPTIQAQLDAANTKKATAVAELAALEKLKTIAEKLAKDMDVKVQKLKQLMPTLKPAPNNSFKDLPAKIADITISRSDELQVQIKDPNGGVSDFHTELLDVMSKQQGDASFAIDGNENIKNPAAFISMLNDALVKAKKEQA